MKGAAGLKRIDTEGAGRNAHQSRMKLPVVVR
jgi:hypothetical protein